MSAIRLLWPFKLVSSKTSCSSLVVACSFLKARVAPPQTDRASGNLYRLGHQFARSGFLDEGTVTLFALRFPAGTNLVLVITDGDSNYPIQAHLFHQPSEPFPPDVLPVSNQASSLSRSASR